MKLRVRSVAVYFAYILLLTALLYLNHFDNAFQFDDSHTVVENQFIRDLSFAWRYFTDATTFSVLQTNQSYRPIVTLSLAVDYWLAGGLNPFFFHLSTFLWYLIYLGTVFLFIKKIFEKYLDYSSAASYSLLATAFLAFHPVNAETVNYVIQRADLYSTLGVLAAFVAFQYSKFLRKSYLYLLPILIGTLAKPTSIMFAPLFFLYVFYFENKWEESGESSKISQVFQSLVKSFYRTLPVLIFCLALYVLQDQLTSKTFTPGGKSFYHYIITQPYVAWHYFIAFFFPIHLSADTDLTTFSSITELRCLFGILFVLSTLLLAAYCSFRRKLFPIAFGLFWFYIAMVPTSFIPLAEVMNDHRMFFPFVGLALAVFYALFLVLAALVERFSETKVKKIFLTVFAAALVFMAYGTYQRNEVWHDPETLWYDVTVKSPKNGRGLMNYGLTQMEIGEYEKAKKYFLEAKEFNKNYATLEINLGIVHGELGEIEKAEAYFRNAIRLNPDRSNSYYFYARWLNKNSRPLEAIEYLQRAVAVSPIDFKSQELLLDLYLAANQRTLLNEQLSTVLKIFPNFEGKEKYLTGRKKTRPEKESEAKRYLQQSLIYYNQGRFQDVIRAASIALQLKPNYAAAYNNISAANAKLQNWDEAILSAQEALRFQADFPLAQGNLDYALKMKAGLAK